MSWSRRALAAFAILLPLAVAGCFRPMLAEGSKSRAMVGKIALPATDDRFSYFLNDALRDRLGSPTAPEWRLEIADSLASQGLGIATDGAVTRFSLTATARWSLWTSDGQQVATGVEQSEGGYSATTSLFATRQTRLDIERRLARDLGERVSRAVLSRAGALVQ